MTSCWVSSACERASDLGYEEPAGAAAWSNTLQQLAASSCRHCLPQLCDRTHFVPPHIWYESPCNPVEKNPRRSNRSRLQLAVPKGRFPLACSDHSYTYYAVIVTLRMNSH
ncbi:unnamed protein product [Sphagnum balticum]